MTMPDCRHRPLPGASASTRRRASRREPAAVERAVARGSRRRAPRHRRSDLRHAVAALRGDRRRAAGGGDAHGRAIPTSSSRSRCAAATAGRGCSTASTIAAIARCGQALAGAQRLHGLPARRAGARRPRHLRRADGGLRLRRRDAVGVHARALLAAARAGRDAVDLRARRARPRGARARCGAATWRCSRTSSARRICRASTAASCSSRTSASIRTASSACSISCTSPAFSRGSGRCCWARSTATQPTPNDNGYDFAAMLAHAARAHRRPDLHRPAVRALSATS